MSNGRLAVPAVVASAFAVLFFGLGSYLGARPSAEADRSRRSALKSISCAERSPSPTGTSGIDPPSPPIPSPVESRAAIVEDVKRQLQSEMGLLPAQR